MKYLVAIALFFAAARAACPNACSNHGECEENDSCNCHAGFQGGDCSERVCLYNWAWVTTANGDLNFDGDRFDGTVYSKFIALPETSADINDGVGGAVLLTQSAPGGTWENWPYYAGEQEGHFYMECSNRGLCDRASGDCVCFDGYTGTACNRMQCPEDCNGRGVCQTVKDYDPAYDLWDRNMARSCKCDHGWTGPACQTRQCPFGNDVLTKTTEQWETQWVDIYSSCEGSGSDCQTLADGTVLLGGYTRLTYTDHFGASYTTEPIAVAAMGDAGSDNVAAVAKAALVALPNDVVNKDITVEAQYCEVGDGTEQTTAAGAITGYAHNAYRVISDDTDDIDTAVIKEDGTTIIAGDSTCTQGSACDHSGTYGVAYLNNPVCIRLKVTFVNMPGSLNLLTVDHSDVTYFGETNAQDNGDNLNANVGSSVVKTRAVTDATLNIQYTTPSTVRVTSQAQIDVAGKTITTADDMLTGTDDKFYPGSRIKVECAETSTDSYRNLGIYTVSLTIIPTATVITVDENIVANECESTADNNVKITSVSNVVVLGNYNPTYLQDFNTVHSIVFRGTTVGEHVSTYNYDDTYDGGVGYLIFKDTDVSYRDFLADSITSDTSNLAINGEGSRENVECGDRGMCQEDGTCKCFSGYSGDACDVQKAISA